jgi:hypothetical protein
MSARTNGRFSQPSKGTLADSNPLDWEVGMNTRPRPSLFGRALLGVLLTIWFYSLAPGIAFGLLYLIYLEITPGGINQAL